MGCSGSKVTPLVVNSPSGNRTADRTPSRSPGTVNEEAHSDASNRNDEEAAAESPQDGINVREDPIERSISESHGAQRSAVVPEQRSVEGALATDVRQAGDKRGRIAASNRNVCDPNNSATYLQPNETVRDNIREIVYRDRIVERVIQERIVERVVEVPHVSDLDMVVQASKYLEHTLRANFSATGDSLGRCILSASAARGGLEQPLKKQMQSIKQLRNKLVHEPNVDQIQDRKKFMEMFKLVWFSLAEINFCRGDCTTCRKVESFITDVTV